MIHYDTRRPAIRAGNVSQAVTHDPLTLPKTDP